ncbi:hypothetical protein [Candidatus Protofrankia californiensis]|uniref:hypothetical protein n=1 Tax=Candidatus Protofrankia californiensis TaxID=1839754 RepID=UPI001F49F61C|nr:hypothetical protein [Candidatus Protofrankia californiensis]
MSRPPVFPAENKIRIVLSVLAGEVTIAEAARRNKVSPDIGREVEAAVPRGRPCRAGGWWLVASVEPGGSARR